VLERLLASDDPILARSEAHQARWQIHRRTLAVPARGGPRTQVRCGW
jgi:hypothetical protein